jgi:hypothetical protein
MLPLQLRRFLHWSRGSVVHSTTMHHILVVIVVVFLQLTHQFSREKFPTKPNCSRLEFFFSLLPTVWFLLTFYSHITTTQKATPLQLHRSVVKQRKLCTPFSIIQARWGTSPCPDKIPATCNKQQQQQQHTKINYKNK